MRNLLPILAATLLAACQATDLRPVETAQAVDLDADIIAGEVVISADVPASMQEGLGLTQVDYDPDLGAGLYYAADDTNLTAIEAALKTDLGDVVVEHNRLATSFAAVNDPYYDLQWNFKQLNIEGAWAYNHGEGVTVAVVDTGVSDAGEDTPVNLVNGVDFVDGGAPTDMNGHGTHVSGTIAQATNNGKGVAGIAYNATILAIRVLDANGSGSMYNVAQGITSAVTNGADVINLSLGTSSSMATVSSAVADAVAKGVVVVAASGNDGKSTVSYPAAYPGVIAVGAVGGDGKVAPYSNGGTALDVVAPGGNMDYDYDKDGYADGIVQETFEGGSWGYQYFEGTSMASPHVAAIAALLLSEGADPTTIESTLRSTATDINTTGFDTKTGYGLVNPVAALAAVSGGGAEPPSSTTPPSTTPSGDTTAPTISGVTGWRSGSTMEISWTTNEGSTTEVDFDTYGAFTSATGYVTSHVMDFTVDASATYYFTLVAVDAAGNKGTSGEWVMYP